MATVKYLVYSVIFLFPFSPSSFCNFFNAGIVDVNICINIDALTFGKIPNENIPKTNCFPCENVLRSDINELPFNESYKYAWLIPEIGMKFPIRIADKIATV